MTSYLPKTPDPTAVVALFLCALRGDPKLELRDYLDEPTDAATVAGLNTMLADARIFSVTNHLAPGWCAVALPIGLPNGPIDLNPGDLMLAYHAILRWRDDRGWRVWKVNGRVPDPVDLPP